MTKHHAGAFRATDRVEAINKAIETKWLRSPLGRQESWSPGLRSAAALLLAAPQPMLVIWGPNHLCLLNGAACVLLDVEPLIAPADAVWPAGWQLLREDILSVLADGPAFHRPEWGVAGRRFSVTCSPIFEGARPGGVLLAMSELPASAGGAARFGKVATMAQAALVASEERLRLGLEAGRMVTWEFDLSTGTLSQSSNSEALFGPGSQFADYTARMPAEDLASDQERLQRALMSPDGLYTSEFRYHHPNGRVMYLQNWGQVMRDATGTPVRVHGVCMDISERKEAEHALVQQVEQRTEELQQAEEALRQAQRMEALGHLTGGVAHDFNNLLGAMIGNFELILRQHDDKARVRSLADAGLLVAERGARLTSQLLTFSRAQRIELVSVSVGALIEGMREMLRRTLGPLVTVSFEIDCGDRCVLSEPTQLEMALLNLTINARDAMPKGGQLTIAAGLRTVGRAPGLKAGEYVELRVTDTGTGMSKEVAARAFDPFFTTKGVGKGTGLGLSQVHGLVRQAGGSVRIESRLQHGSAIVLMLPCTDAPARRERRARAASTPRPVEGATVLLVDDDHDLRAVLGASLQDLGYRVVEAADGAEGLALLERHAPDLLVSDVAMPGMTGVELARTVRLQHPTLPVILASGFAEMPAIEIGSGPAPRVLRKPFRLSELQGEIEAALRGRVGKRRPARSG